MIDVSEIIDDPDFVQIFKLYRITGQFVNGRWVEDAKQELTRRGVIVPAGSKTLRQLPEADRIIAAIDVYTKEIMYLTSNAENQARTSDQILWKGDLYKLLSVDDYSDHGFYHGVGQRIRGN